MRRSTTLPLVVAVACVAAGCVDTRLLDEMTLIDAGADLSGPSSAGSADGALVPSGPPATDGNDTAPPAWHPLACGAAEQQSASACISVGHGAVAVRIGTDSPAEIIASATEGTAIVLSAPWDNEHHVVIHDLTAGQEQRLSLCASDVNGNAATLELTVTAADGPRVAITEVLADPLGSEPGAEFVELANYGKDPIDLSGWMLDDNSDQNGDVLPSGTVLEAYAIAIIVGPGFTPSGEDPPPLPGIQSIALSSSIGSNGLSNSSPESIELYDAKGALVSRYDGSVDPPPEGCSVVRRARTLPDADAAAFALDPAGTSTPGALRD